MIKLIPNKDAEQFYVKNWRPITLLKFDYKIAAKAIADRLKNVIPKIINNDQTGFFKGRFIRENIRLIDGIINYTASHNMPGLLRKNEESLKESLLIRVKSKLASTRTTLRLFLMALKYHSRPLYST